MITAAQKLLIAAAQPVYGHAFFTQAEWSRFTHLGSVQRRIQLQAAWWRVELWLQAQHQNLSCN